MGNEVYPMKQTDIALQGAATCKTLCKKMEHHKHTINM